MSNKIYGARCLAFQTTNKKMKPVRKLDIPKALIRTKLSEMGSIPARYSAEYLTLKVWAKPLLRSISPARASTITLIFKAVSLLSITKILKGKIIFYSTGQIQK